MVAMTGESRVVVVSRASANESIFSPVSRIRVRSCVDGVRHMNENARRSVAGRRAIVADYRDSLPYEDEKARDHSKCESIRCFKIRQDHQKEITTKLISSRLSTGNRDNSTNINAIAQHHEIT